MNGVRWSLVVGILAGLLTTSLASTNVPDDSQKQRVLVIGDSLMRAVSREFGKQVTDIAHVEPVFLVCLGSGLARLDLFDWHAKIEKLVRDNKPTAAMVFIGANDDQPMRTPGGVIQPGTEDWLAEYTCRIARAMDLLLDGGVEHLYWIGLPDMRDPKLQRCAILINQVVAKLVQSRPRVQLIDTTSMFSRKPGTFSPYIYKEDGMPLHVRDTAGVHLNRKGADILVRDLLPRILNDLPPPDKGETP